MTGEQNSRVHEDTKTRRTTKLLDQAAIPPLPESDEIIGKEVVDAAYQVHRALGPGLLERVYSACFCHELSRRGIEVAREISIPIVYEGLALDDAFRLDVLVADTVVCELKAAEDHNVLWRAQLLSYLKLSGKRLGFLINFNVPLIKNGIRRYVV